MLEDIIKNSNNDLEEVFRNLIKIAKDGKKAKTTYYLGVRD